jgi:hypothetical protein
MAPHLRTRWRPGPEILFAASVTLLFVIAQPADQWVFHHFAYPAIYDHGWGRMLRVAGYVPLWGLVALALVLHAWVPRVGRTLRASSRRGLLLLWSAALGGAVAELLKLALRRPRVPALVRSAVRDRPTRAAKQRGSGGIRRGSDAG